MNVRSLSLLVVIFGVGCVKKDTGTLGEADSQNAGKALAAGIEDGTTTFGPVSTQGAGLDAPCVTLSGDSSDPDQDSIPTSATLTFNCTSMAFGYTGTVTGTEMVSDGQPNAIAWAFNANADLHSTLTGPGGASITNDRMGTITAAQGSVLGPFTLDRALDVTTDFKNAAGTTLATVTETNAWTITYTPQATWTPGGVVLTGSVTATGSWDVAVNSNSANATIATPTALTLTPSCATRITAGVVTGTYKDGVRDSTITVTWTGCGTSVVTYVTR
jgi:hypothetical protein